MAPMVSRALAVLAASAMVRGCCSADRINLVIIPTEHPDDGPEPGVHPSVSAQGIGAGRRRSLGRKLHESGIGVDPRDPPPPPPTQESPNGTTAVVIEHACEGRIDMDYGGNVSYVDYSDPLNPKTVLCGFAPVVDLVSNHDDWTVHEWYSGPYSVDPTMDSPFECQRRCYVNFECEYFVYIIRPGNPVFHNCYMKGSYDDPRCMEDPYGPFPSEGGMVRHGESGPGIPCDEPTALGVIGEDGLESSAAPRAGGRWSVGGARWVFPSLLVVAMSSSFF